MLFKKKDTILLSDDLNEGNRNILIVAGEASGDMYGADLVKEMLKIYPDLRFYGIGGTKLKEAGVELIADAAQISVVGLTEVFSKLSNFFKVIKKLKNRLDALKPALVILIDFPDFNLNIVARQAKKRNIKIFYYISPQVWAWRKGRIKQIKKLVDKMAVILPFEVDLYAKNNFPVNYVGHPLVDIVKINVSKEKARIKLGLSEDKTTIGLLPGSRTAEIKSLLPEMMQAAQILKKNIKNAQFILPQADTLDEAIIEGIISKYDIEVKVIAGRTYEAISCCDLAVVTSGTATLETGLLGVPMIIVYKVSLLSYLIGRLVINVKNIGLVNIIAGKTVVPEFIQKEANGRKIAAEALAILESERYEQIKKELSAISAKMGKPGAAARTAQIACSMV
ncbi:MAG: lipid-A-disaccharide synthase [Syntrophaceae bacterium]|nr:lipid-A-disaccharide synthase [Syntrophaceae bacterium]